MSLEHEHDPRQQSLPLGRQVNEQTTGREQDRITRCVSATRSVLGYPLQDGQRKNHWQEASLGARFEMLSKIELKVADIENRMAANIDVREEFSTEGHYDPLKNKIVFSRKLLEKEDVVPALRTLWQQQRHAVQYAAIELESIKSSFSEKGVDLLVNEHSPVDAITRQTWHRERNDYTPSAPKHAGQLIPAQLKAIFRKDALSYAAKALGVFEREPERSTRKHLGKNDFAPSPEGQHRITELQKQHERERGR